MGVVVLGRACRQAHTPTFVGQRQERFTFRASEAAAGVFTQEEQHKRENQAEADC
jgi:hypothetical protein